MRHWRGLLTLLLLAKRVYLTSLFQSGALEGSGLATFLAVQGFDGGALEAFSKTGIPDLAAASIIEYYAFEDGSYGVAVPQIEALQFVNHFHASRDLKTLLGDGFQFDQVRTKLVFYLFFKNL